MNSILLGCSAALSWGVHDLLIRFVGRGLGTVTALLAVLGIGVVVMSAVIAVLGVPVGLAMGDLWLPAVSGIAYAIACHGLYQAMSIGPFALAAPIIAAYPILSVGWAVVHGARPALIDWVATAAIIAGVVIVSRFANEEETAGPEEARGSRSDTIVAALYSAVGFAVSFAAGQAAAGDQHEIAVTALARVFAVLAILPLFMSQPKDDRFPKGSGRYLPLVFLVATLDVIAITCVVAAGALQAPELTVVVASSFGVITIVLARLFLKERVASAQWLGIAMVFASVMVLSTRY